MDGLANCTFEAAGEQRREEKAMLFQHGPPDILVTNPETLHYQVCLTYTCTYRPANSLTVTHRSPVLYQLYRGRKGEGLWQHWRTYLGRLGICVLVRLFRTSSS